MVWVFAKTAAPLTLYCMNQRRLDATWWNCCRHYLKIESDQRKKREVDCRGQSSWLALLCPEVQTWQKLLVEQGRRAWGGMDAVTFSGCVFLHWVLKWRGKRYCQHWYQTSPFYSSYEKNTPVATKCFCQRPELALECNPAAHTTLLRYSLKWYQLQNIIFFTTSFIFNEYGENKTHGPAFNNCKVFWSWWWTMQMQSPEGEEKVHACLLNVLGISQQICRRQNTEEYLKKIEVSPNKSKQLQLNYWLFSPPTLRGSPFWRRGAAFAKCYDEESHVIGASPL